MDFDKVFYKKYGYKVSYETTTNLEEQEQEDYESAYEIAQVGVRTKNRIPAAALRDMKRFAEKYPDSPAFKNNLYVAYMVNKDESKASRLLLEIVNRHPDYLFGKVNLANKFLAEDNLNAALKLLGTSRKLHDFLPNQEVFHVVEFLNYQQAAAEYELKTGDEAAAKERLEMMIDLHPEHDHTRRVGKAIMVARLRKSVESHKRALENKIEVVFKPSYTLEQTKNPPILTHEELESLYLYSDEELPKEMMKDIMELPRESLITDLEKILEDSIRRYDFFHTKREKDGFNKDGQSFLIHAFRFLTILGDEKSLSGILNILRQSEGFLNYWFGDWGLYVEEPLFLLGKNQLDILKSYVFETHQHVFARVYAAKVAAQVGLHYPERRDEAIQWYIEVFEYLLARENDEGIIDSSFVSWMLWDAKKLRAPEMIPYIEKMGKRGWIIDVIGGDVEEIKKGIVRPAEPSLIDPMPQNIYEIYTRGHLKRRPKMNTDEFDKILNSKTESYMMYSMYGSLGGFVPDDDDEVFRASDKKNNDSGYYTEPVRRDSPKIGRNEPCLCGSGKKYKKCCLNK